MEQSTETNTAATTQNHVVHNEIQQTSLLLPQGIRCLIALLYRNILAKWRHPIASFLEIAIPIAVCLCLFIPRSDLKTVVTSTQRYLTDDYYKFCPFGLYGPRTISGTLAESVPLPSSALGGDVNFNTAEDVLCERWDNLLTLYKTPDVSSRSQQHKRRRLQPTTDSTKATSNDSIFDFLTMLAKQFSWLPFRQGRTYDALHLLELPTVNNPFDEIVFAGINNPGCENLADYLEDFLSYLLPYKNLTSTWTFNTRRYKDGVDPERELLTEVPSKIMQIWDQTDERIKDPIDNSKDPRVIFICRSALSGNLDVEIRMNPKMNVPIPQDRIRPITYDNVDYIRESSMTANYGGTTIQGRSRGASFLDYQGLLMGYALLNSEIQPNLRQLFQKPVPPSPFVSILRGLASPKNFRQLTLKEIYDSRYPYQASNESAYKGDAQDFKQVFKSPLVLSETIPFFSNATDTSKKLTALSSSSTSLYFLKKIKKLNFKSLFTSLPDKPLCEEIDVLRIFSDAFRTPDPQTSLKDYVERTTRVLCIICHKDFAIYKTKPFDGCDDFHTFLLLVYPTLAPLWITSITEQPIFAASPYDSYCASPIFQQFIDMFTGRENVQVQNETSLNLQSTAVIKDRLLKQQQKQKNSTSTIMMKMRRLLKNKLTNGYHNDTKYTNNNKKLAASASLTKNRKHRHLQKTRLSSSLIATHLNELGSTTTLLSYIASTQILQYWGTTLLNPALSLGASVSFRESALPLPNGSYDQYTEFFLKGNLWGFAWITVFLFPLRAAINLVMVDKEFKMKELFKIFGMTEAVLWLSVYIFCTLWFFVLNLALALCTTFILPHAPFFLLWVLFTCYIIACISFAILISSFFTKGLTAFIIAVGAYYMMFQAYSAIESGYLVISISLKYLAMLLFPCAFSWGFQSILAHQFSSLQSAEPAMTYAQVRSAYMGVSLGKAYGFLILDSVLYFVIGWYFHQLFPGEFGKSQPWYFPFTMSYWTAGSYHKKQNHTWLKRLGLLKLKGKSREIIKKKKTSNEKSFSNSKDPHVFEPVDERNRNVTVSVKNIIKKFPIQNIVGKKIGSHTAIKGVNVEIYEGEIFALLGHNGAGKTTLINILTGMLAPTHGTAEIMGYDIVSEINIARKYTGYCPQANLLFDFLTVKEHLKIFGYMKGVAWKDMDNEIQSILSILEIEHKINTKSKALSGGQKRRLQVALALIGGSKAIFLDEPSSGMDPYTRRALWDTLRKIKAGRSIILTTHYMEEADVLGDRVAIMAGGRIRCMGTPLFLKTKYGAGYTLTLTKRDDYSLDQEETLISLILSALPNSKRLSNIALEISFSVPFEAVQPLPDILETLECRANDYGIKSFSLGVTSLEEVFLRIGAEHITDFEETTLLAENKKANVLQTLVRRLSNELQEEPQSIKASLSKAAYADLSRNSLRLSNRYKPEKGDIFAVAGYVPTSYKKSFRYRCRQLYTLFVKRFKLGIRDFYGLFCQILVPIILVFLMLLVSYQVESQTFLPSIKIIDAIRFYPYEVLTPQTIFYGMSSSVPLDDQLAFENIMQTCTSYSNSLWSLYKVSQSSNQKAFEDFLLHAPSTLDRNQAKPSYIAFYLDELNGVNIIHDDRYQHSISLGVIALTDCVIKFGAVAQQGDVAKPSTIKIENYPLPRATFLRRIVAQITTSLWAAIGFSLIPSTWGSIAITERHNQAKHAQHIAGVSVTMYWITLWLWDFIVYLIGFASILALLGAFGSQCADSYRIGVTIVAGLLFGIAVGPFIYCCSFMLKTPLELQVVMKLLALIVPFIIGILQIIPTASATYYGWLQYLLFFIPHVSITQVLLSTTWFWFPTAGAFNAFSPSLTDETATVWNCKLAGLPLIYLALSTVVWFILTVCIDAVVSYPKPRQLLQQLRTGSCITTKKNKLNNSTGIMVKHNENPSFYDAEDEDVHLERKRAEALFLHYEHHHHNQNLKTDIIDYGKPREQFVAATPPSTTLINLHKTTTVVHQYNNKNTTVPGLIRSQSNSSLAPAILLIGLKKIYQSQPIKRFLKKWFCYCNKSTENSVIAVRDLSFKVEIGQCFGFLGINGAGKTTAIQMITGALTPTAGYVFVANHDVTKETASLWEKVGYCPQCDALFDNLTGAEHIVFYGRLAGISETQLEWYTLQVLDVLGLLPYKHRLVKTYSGGSKRRLSVGIAFIKNPEVIFLDEPSCGVDPVSRRKLWTLISETTRQSGRAIMLTTHLMEECEALCDRLAIMQNGRLLCIGTPSHLKSRFGRGYELEVTFESTMEDDKEYNDQHQKKALSQSLSKSLSKKNTNLIPSSSSSYANDFVTYIQNYAPGTTVIETIGFHIRLTVPKQNIVLATLFRLVESAREKFHVHAYAISEASLESIFVQFQQTTASSTPLV